ncbi:hypothetical protein RF55_17725 [Lasius niger]|uniref:Uncharacterized protein n=1 Tax=Lasius niger TaxID=67767 RepID=A0A0J7MVE3_LASNI|nr:hypothetical protein RF55_17725 [Lasius niger]
MLRCDAMAMSVAEESYTANPTPFSFVQKPENVSGMGMDILQKPGTNADSWKIVAMPLDIFVALANNSYYSTVVPGFTYGGQNSLKITGRLRDVDATVNVWKGPTSVAAVSSWPLWEKFWSRNNISGIRRDTILAHGEICTRLGVSDACGTSLSLLAKLYKQWNYGLAVPLKDGTPQPDYSQAAYGAWTYDRSALDKTGNMKSQCSM